MAETRISADWAWISKDPAEGIGYSVLATSDAEVDFRPFIGSYVAGSPSSTTPPDAPDAPPWVTFGPIATKHDGVLMSVSVRDPWDGRDHAGRPVWPQRLFVMRFDDLAAAGASYQTMWGAAEHAQVSRDESAPLPLTVSGQLTGALAATIVHYGLAQLGAVAAALLDGPVAVADAAGLPRDERLKVLDAIAALLPYGFRADLSASSVVDNTVRHGIRLVFADYPGPGQQLRSLRTPAPPPESELGRFYLATLVEKDDARGTQELVDHLWAFKKACSFRYPRAAPTILTELDFYGGFGKALRAGRAPRDQVLKFFADPAKAQEKWAAFDQTMRENAISPYLADRDEEVMVAALRCWEFTRQDVVRVVNHHLGERGAPFGLWCLKAARAVPSGEPRGTLADRLLAKMLVPVGLLEREYSGRIAILVQLLQQCPVPSPRQLRYTCDELRFGDLAGWQSHLVRELLAGEAATSADRVAPWVRWLCQSQFTASWERPVWVAALDFMLVPSAADNARTVIRQDAKWAAVLLRVAERFRCLNRLIAAAARDLLELAIRLPAPDQQGSPAAALYGELDKNLWLLDVPPACVAAIDLVRVLLGGPPRDLAGRLTETQLDGYGDGLNPLLRLDVLAPRLAAIEQAYLRHAVSGNPQAELDDAGVWLLDSWAADPGHQAGLCDFIAALDPAARPHHENLGDAYWDALAMRPELADYAAAQQLVIAARESVRAPRTAFRRRVTDGGITTTPLARACLRARCAGLRPAAIVIALANAGASKIAVQQLDDVLRELQQLLACHYLDAPGTTGRAAELSPRKAAAADLYECQALIVWGGLGEDYGEQFRLHLAGRSHQEGQTQRRLVRLFRKARRKRGRVDRAEWVGSVVQTGLGMRRPPWYRRWAQALWPKPISRRGGSPAG